MSRHTFSESAILHQRIESCRSICAPFTTGWFALGARSLRPGTEYALWIASFASLKGFIVIMRRICREICWIYVSACRYIHTLTLINTDAYSCILIHIFFAQRHSHNICTYVQLHISHTYTCNRIAYHIILYRYIYIYICMYVCIYTHACI